MENKSSGHTILSKNQSQKKQSYPSQSKFECQTVKNHLILVWVSFDPLRMKGMKVIMMMSLI